jgi:phospholipase C
MGAQIDHVVVLMLENRSFDHLFGYWPGAEGLAAGGFSNRLDPTQPESQTNQAFPTGTAAPWVVTKGQGPGHSLNATNVQLCNDKLGPTSAHPTRLNGFVRSYHDELLHDHVAQPNPDDLAVVMQSFAVDRLPALSALARHFVLCDRWHSEVPGPTMPNRLYMHAATSAGYAHNDWKHVFDFRTIYENLQDAGRTWAVYYSDDNEVAKFSRVNGQRASFRIFEDRFVTDANAGKLPNYTFIIPRFASSKTASEPANSMHAPQDIRPGDTLVADVYEALHSNAAAWQKTLLVVTFDEHGGFYDHVVPPAAVNPDGINSPAPGDAASFAPTFSFDRLGLRVPTILVSPWLPKGKIDSTPYQHTSVLSTVKKIFGLPNFLTKRDQHAETFDQTFLSAPRTDTPITLPRITMPAKAVTLADSEHPGNQPTGDIVDSLVEGWHGIMQGLAGSGPQAATAAVRSQPVKQHEAHDYLRAQVERYLAHRAQAKPA